MIRTLLLTICLYSACLPAFAKPSALARPLQVVSSIKPLHLLVLAIGGDRVDSKVLLKAATSPHHYALRLSEMKTLSDADVVFWIGPQLEQFLEKPLFNLRDRVSVVALSPSAREANAGESSQHPGDQDSHFWLDPQLALVLAGHIKNALINHDGLNKQYFQDNFAEFRRHIQNLDRQIAARLEPVRDVGFIVLHDAYGFYVQRYGLNQLGALSRTAEYHQGARHLDGLRKQIKQGRVACLFREPQFDARVFRALAEGVEIGFAELDPLAGLMPASKDGYMEFMQHLTAQVFKCLSARNAN